MAKKEHLNRTIFDWDYFSVYLSGPIDFGRETAASWRKDFTERLIDIGFKPHQIFDPCKKPLGNAPFNLDDEGTIMQKHRERREWADLKKIVSQIVHIDLRLVDKSDIIVVNLPKYSQEFFSEQVDAFMEGYKTLFDLHEKNDIPVGALQKMYKAFFDLLAQAADHRIPTYGTVHELVVAHLQQKPIFLVWEGGKETCSGWLMYLVGHNNVFGSLDEVVTRLDNISKGKTAYNAKEWLLLDLGKDD